MSLRVAAVVFCGLTASLIVVTSILLPFTPPAAFTSSKTALTAPRAVTGKETTPPSVTIWPTLMVWPPDDPPPPVLLPPPPPESSLLPHPAAANRQPTAASAITRLVPRTMNPPPVLTTGRSAYVYVAQADRALVIQAYVREPTDGRLRLSSHRRRVSSPHVRVRSLRPDHGIGRSAHRPVPRADVPDGGRDQLRAGVVRDVRGVHDAPALRRGLGLPARRRRRPRHRRGPLGVARPRDAALLP